MGNPHGGFHLPGYPRTHWKWHYEHGLFVKAVLDVSFSNGNSTYGMFVHDWVDYFVTPGGQIRSYHLNEFNLDYINPGKLLFHYYQQSGDSRYEHAIELLANQLRNQPRTKNGGFWHKKIYPGQIWLDGLYMSAPFYARYAQAFDQPAIFDDVTRQLILIEKLTRDPITGLLYHAWDESRNQQWADPQTGCSPNFWGRAMGWYMMALVDVLEILPTTHHGRSDLVEILQRLAHALLLFQDPASGLWYQVVDMPNRPGNYLESSVSAMLAYAFTKSVLKATHDRLSHPGQARLSRFVGKKDAVDARGMLTLEGTCSVAGLGGNPYRAGTYDYYIGEKTKANDFKGVAAFILASLEMDAVGVE